MYRIVRKLDDKYQAVCNIQDGTEYYIKNSREEAIKALIHAAKIMNGTDITEKDIIFGQEKQVVVTEVIWEESKKCRLCGH